MIANSCRSMMRVLNVAEKNDAAKNISGILSRGNRNVRNSKSKYNKIYSFQCEVPQLGGRCDMTMYSVSGHLMELEFDDSRFGWSKCQNQVLFDAPLREVVHKNHRDIETTLKDEARKHQALIIWTDGDREGENIGFQIIRVCSNVNRNLRVLRARFSEITPRAMASCIANLVDPNEHVSSAVDIRKELDIRFGYAFTRYQTDLLKRSGCLSRGEVVSYGPCQFPTMGFVINRYLEILRFVSEPFWLINVTDERDNIKVGFNWKKHRLFNERECLACYMKIMECPKARVTGVVLKRKNDWRPEAMYTTSMEKLASNKLKMTAKEAMDTAERLYTQGYISYPRTETNIFPQGMNLHNLVEIQTEDHRWGSFATRILREGGPRPRNGKKTDNAHPPIHPTKKGDGLVGREAQLYELIARHFLACVSKDAVGNETTITINMNGEEFHANGLVILEHNYLEVYPYHKWNAKEVPRYYTNEEFVPQSVMMVDGRTTPPQLLTEAELISLMEKNGIGTDATHADHIQKILDRHYVKKLPKNKRFCPTKLGLALFDGYSAMQFAHLIKPDLRCRLEKDLVEISENRRNPREVALQYIDEHKNIYQIVDRDQQKLVYAFSTNKAMQEPEQRLKSLYPTDYN